MGSLAKDSRSLVIDLINSDNSTAFAYDELVLSPPTVNDIVTYNRNTVVTVTSSDAFQFEGAEPMYYNRLDFSMLFAGLTITLGGAGATNISSLLPELNATFGLGLTMEDLVAQAIPANATYPLAMTLQALDSSYAYVGSFPIIVQNIAPQIGNNLVDTVLNNIGCNAVTLQTAVNDMNTLSAAVIHMNLDRYRRDNYLRALSEDVKNDAMVAIRQALDISGFDDADRAMAADIADIRATIAGLNVGIPSAVQTQINTNTANVTALQAQQATDVAAITALQTSVAALASPVRQTFVLNAPAGGLQVKGEIVLGNMMALLTTATDTPCRLRFYATALDRDNDAPRGVLSDPSPGAGCLYEATTTLALLSWNNAPIPWLQNNDAPLTGKIYYTLEPSTSSAVNLSFQYLVIES